MADYSLERLDPADAWRAWHPGAGDPWGRKWAAHLYRRAAFGASREELIEAERLGPGRTLELLVQGRPEAEQLLEPLIDVGRIAAERDDGGEQLRGWWVYCMLEGGHPLREKLTLFWHNHFATSLAKVQDSDLMFRQNCLLRAHALGNFGRLLHEISRDGAMLLWLDSNSNVRGRPNENYARELMELFSMGVGNYTERDVREAARAFTAWHTDGRGFKFDARAHDCGEKTVLGQTGPWDGDDVVRIVLQQPATARFLVRKLYSFFISENARPPDALLEPLCESFRASGYDVTALVKKMLSSQHFYSAHAFRQRVKGPVEYVLGAVAAVYRRSKEGESAFRPLPPKVVAGRIGPMGQPLFAPPNVKGWQGGRAWLNTSTLLERDNFAAALAMGSLWRNAAAEAPDSAGKAPSPGEFAEEVPRALDPARLIHDEAAQTPEEIVRALLDLYVPGGIDGRTRAELLAFVAQGNPSGKALDRRVRETVHAIMTIGEFHLA